MHEVQEVQEEQLYQNLVRGSRTLMQEALYDLTMVYRVFICLLHEVHEVQELQEAQLY